MNNSKFSTYNPIINFVFFIGAIVFGMFFMHPAFLLCTVVMSFALLTSIKGTGALKYFVILIPLFIFVSLINPLFNTYGDTVIFTYFGGRPYTLEALYYGLAVAAMFISILMWFASYNEMMTSDKFLYIFGRFAPAISIIITMVMRLVPNYSRKAKQISTARKCIGKAGSSDDKRAMIDNGATVLSALTTYALEGGIITADSMKSRGYGVGKRTSFSVYRWDSRDKLLLLILLFLAATIVFCAANGGTYVTYTPHFYIHGLNNAYTLIGSIAYFTFLIIPTILNVTEAITWRILRSRI